MAFNIVGSPVERLRKFEEKIGDRTYEWSVKYRKGSVDGQDYILVRECNYYDKAQEIAITETEEYFRDGYPKSYVKKNEVGVEYDSIVYSYENRGRKGMRAFRTWTQQGRLYGGRDVGIGLDVLKGVMLDPAKLAEVNAFVAETNLRLKLHLREGDTPAELYRRQTEGRDSDREVKSVSNGGQAETAHDEVAEEAQETPDVEEPTDPTGGGLNKG